MHKIKVNSNWKTRKKIRRGEVSARVNQQRGGLVPTRSWFTRALTSTRSIFNEEWPDKKFIRLVVDAVSSVITHTNLVFTSFYFTFVIEITFVMVLFKARNLFKKWKTFRNSTFSLPLSFFIVVVLKNLTFSWLLCVLAGIWGHVDILRKVSSTQKSTE